MANQPNWKSEQRRKNARKLLLHYLTLDKDLGYDCYTEIENIIDSIFDEIDDANERTQRLSERLAAAEQQLRAMQPREV
jgi:hypothetical protein